MRASDQASQGFSDAPVRPCVRESDPSPTAAELRRFHCSHEVGWFFPENFPQNTCRVCERRPLNACSLPFSRRVGWVDHLFVFFFFFHFCWLIIFSALHGNMIGLISHGLYFLKATSSVAGWQRIFLTSNPSQANKEEPCSKIRPSLHVAFGGLLRFQQKAKRPACRCSVLLVTCWVTKPCSHDGRTSAGIEEMKLFFQHPMESYLTGETWLGLVGLACMCLKNREHGRPPNHR